MVSAHSLVEACNEDEFCYITNAAFADYFRTRNDKDLTTMLGLYQGLVFYRDVDEELLHNCLLTGRLEELIHTKYKNRPSGHYVNFLKMVKNGYRLDGFVTVQEETHRMPITE